MASQVKIYLNGNEVKYPIDFKNLRLSVTYDKDDPQQQTRSNSNEWEFTHEEAKLINNWPVFKGLPIRVDQLEDNLLQTLIDDYIDLTDSATFECHRVKVKSKPRKNIDWLSDKSGFTFEYLYNIGKITNNDFVFVPYCLEEEDEAERLAMLVLSVVYMEQQIESAIEKITALGIEMANPFEATAIVRAITYILYLTLLIIAFIKLVKDMILLIIQPVKYHAAMRTKDLFRIGCEHLGLTFKSPEIFDIEPYSKEVIMPQKFNVARNKEDDRILGFLQPNKNEQIGYYKGSFSSFLQAQKIKHNAKLVLTSNGDLFFVRRDYQVFNQPYKIPDLKQTEHTINASELQSNIVISFSTDSQDINTIQEWKGTNYQIITRSASEQDSELDLTTGLVEYTVPFALAKRKTKLNKRELIVKGFLDTFSFLINGLVEAINVIIDISNAIIKTINKVIKALGTIGIKLSFQIKPIKNLQPVDLSASIENRINMVKLETDFTTIPKVFLLDEGNSPKFNKLAPTNETYLSAKYLWQRFYYIDSFVPSNEFPDANQYKIKSYINVPFCLEDYIKVMSDNIVLDSQNKKAKLINLEYYPMIGKADITVAINELYDSDLQTIEIEPDGR